MKSCDESLIFIDMHYINSIAFFIVAIILSCYTFFWIDPHHYFVINAAWNSNLIEAKLTAYLISGLGVCLALFYVFFTNILYSNRLIYLHIILYTLLAINIILWDSNIFSLQEIVDSQTYNSLGEIKSEYSNVLDKDHAYRVCFWILLSTQTIGLLNLLLGFFKPNSN